MFDRWCTDTDANHGVLTGVAARGRVPLRCGGLDYVLLGLAVVRRVEWMAEHGAGLMLDVLVDADDGCRSSGGWQHA